MAPDPDLICEDVARALQEDRAADDLTAALIPERVARATLYCRQKAVLCGIPWAEETFRQLDSAVTLQWHAQDGDMLEAEMAVCSLQGPARALLRGERTALNFLQLLSATASCTRRFVQHLSGDTCTLLDTRKTLPGLRHAQKYAVRCGGGTSHRAHLAEAILIKENHWALLDDVAATLADARKRYPDMPIIVEVETLEQLQAVQAADPDVILLDNFDVDKVREARTLCPNIALEVSGGVDETNIAAYAAAGAARLSVGALTKNVQAIDFSMQMETP